LIYVLGVLAKEESAICFSWIVHRIKSTPTIGISIQV